MTSAASPREIDRREKLVRGARDNDKLVTTELMRTVHGRMWIWNQLAFAQLYIGDENLDPHRMAFDKGRRNTGLKLLASVQRYAPTQFVRMLEENSGVKLEEDNGRPSDDNDDGSES